MAPESSNWLSFSLSPMEMLSSSSQAQMLQPTMKIMPFDGASGDSQQCYFLDNFYANGWENKAQEDTAQNIADSTIFTTFLDSQIQQQPPPKLEDFLGNDSSLVRYSDSQTETQDSSLTHLYDQGGSAYFHDHNDLKTVPAAAGFQAFSGNSGSEVDDSVSVARTQLGSTESGTELGFSQCPNGALSLGVRARGSVKALVSVDSESCKKISDTFGQRTSIYRGVTRHRWTGRYEAHLWDNSCRREGQARKGRQVYLGGYDKEDKAARAYDLAALKYWGPTATTNFPVSSYTKEIEEMKHATKQEFIASLRRKSSGFSRGASIYRGVTRHHQQGRWQARIGRVAGNKDLYLGTFATEEEAAEAYDIAAIKFRGVNAVTNFEMNRYDVEAIMKSSLPIGGAAKRLKLSLEAEQKPSLNHDQPPPQCTTSSSINFSTNIHPLAAVPCGVPFDTTARYHHNLFHLNTDGASDLPGPATTTPMTFMPTPAEFFIWPHQSY
ncbi:AP2-like ethylene-responsive transcription factor [Actinidia chinensis var. chinensis]|uniref:AP2-like ethylene-responsive transcription factor n=1 Tax=Actinidia chinensis var. chinensis TaxID=1590841 RepID=A0A2R6R646_ACTCC|nr:AP2-like ethylene-responsive transcription factor [Actinidia chinensis var. chinensis]